jgi:uncharacterized protein YodC (DUF2158 family)
MEITSGSVVRLKSGGAEMTVARIETQNENGVVTKYAVCGWHIGKKPELRTYPVHMLELVR